MDNAKTVITSRQVLDETPGRALSFLRALGTVPAIATALGTKGYTAEEHREGWALLHRAAGYERTTPPPIGKEVSDAIAELDAWDEPNFRIIAATLDRHAPEQGAFVFHELSPATGAGAILSVKTLLDRLDALEGSPDRKATRKADLAAVALLEKKGYSKEERKRLRGLISTAERVADTGAPAPVPADEKEHVEDLEKLRAWYVEWSETARVVVKRRDYVDELLASRIKLPPGVDPLSLEDMERAIAEGSLGR